MITPEDKIYSRIYDGGGFRLVDINHLMPNQIHIHGIAHSLSLLCRFGGNLIEHYSVAQHSVILSQILEEHGPKKAMWGLMHDASEAYVTDLPSPIKHQLDDFMDLENRIVQKIAEKFELGWPMPMVVKKEDQILIRREQICLQRCLPISGESVGSIVPVSALEAEIMFLRQYLKLKKELLLQSGE